MNAIEQGWDGDTMRPVPFDEERHDRQLAEAFDNCFGQRCPQCHVSVKAPGFCQACNEKIMDEIERSRLRITTTEITTR